MTTISLIFSVVALMVSAVLALHQLTLVRHSNAMPLVVDLFREWRGAKQRAHRRYVLQNLQADCDPTLGYDGLPKESRKHVEEVSHLIDNVSVLVVNGMVDPGLVSGFIGDSILSLWEVLAPYIRHEEASRGKPYQAYFQDLACKLMEVSPSHSRKALKSVSERGNG